MRPGVTSDSGIAVCQAEIYSPRPLTEGERWTAESLSELRRGGYRPSAWLEFLRSSLERSGEARRQRLPMARQAGAWGTLGAVGWMAACLLSRRAGTVHLRIAPGLLWWWSVWRMLDWHLGMAEGGDGQPRERLSPADAVTLTRFWMVPAVPALTRSQAGLPAVILIGGLTDWLDGALARSRGRTRLGRDLDTTADLAFLGTVAVSGGRAGRLPRAGCWALCARYGIGVAVSLLAVFGKARRPAVRARPWGALLRVGGLAICAAGREVSGTTVLLVGCAVPPRSTAPYLSRA